MPSTLNVDVAVNQSQLQSAVSSIQKTISSASYGSGGYGGFAGGGPGGFAFPASFSGGAMPGRGAFIIPPHPHQYAVQSSSMPVNMMRQQINGLMQNTMAQAAGGGGMKSSLQYMMPEYAPMSQGKLLMGATAKAIGSGSLYNIGSAFGAGIGAMTGLPFMPMVGAFAGGWAADKMFGKSVKGFVENMVYGGTKDRAYSSKAMGGVISNMKRSTMGSFMASTMGFNPVDFATDRSRSGFVQQLGKMNLGLARKLRMEPGELASTTHAMAFSSRGVKILQDQAKMLDSMKSASTGEFDDRAFKASAPRQRFVEESLRIRNIASRLNMAPAEVTLGEEGFNLMGRYRKPKVSAYTKMGWHLGKRMGTGKQWGKDLIYAAKPLATTDLNMSRDQLRTMGNKRQRTAAYAQFALSGFKPGGQNWYRTMLMGAGKVPGSLFDVGGQMASAFADPQAGMQAMVDADLTMRKMGGAGIVSLQRKTAMDTVSFMRQIGMIDNNMTNSDAYQSHLMSQGMGATQARAMARATMGVGDPILYSRGSKLAEVKAGNGLSSYAVAMIRKDAGVTAGQPLMVSSRYGKEVKNVVANATRIYNQYKGKYGSEEEVAKALREGKITGGLSREGRMITAAKITGKDFGGVLRHQTEMVVRRVASGELVKGAGDFRDKISELGGGSFSKGVEMFANTLKDPKRGYMAMDSDQREIFDKIKANKEIFAAGKEYIRAGGVKHSKDMDAGGLTGSQWDELLGKTKGLFDSLQKIVDDIKKNKAR